MKIIKLSSWFLLFIWNLLSISFASSPILPTQLQIEYLTNPIGLDVKKPRFSWILESKRLNYYGGAQNAYRILVASSPKLLKAGKSDLWDSQWVSSSQMSQIEYNGAPLFSDKTYYWTVAIKDEKNKISDWGKPNYWTTGLLEDNLWNAKWIGGNEVFDPKQEDCNISDPWLRKTFDLNFVPKQANIYVASIGFHEIYVNGKRIGEEVMAPAVSDHTKRARYVVYDIAPYLMQGKNVIALWLGTSWSIFPAYVLDNSRPLTPMVAAQVDFYQDPADTKPRQTVITDESWKIKDSPNKLLGIWYFHRMGGEIWDDRQSIENWNLLSYDDKEWNDATVYNQDLKISAQNTKGNKIYEAIKPIAIEERADGSFRVDMGVNFAGWTEVKLCGNEGDRIDFYYSEREQEDMTFGLRSAFILGKSGRGVFKNRFNYSSGRWITIKGLKYKPSLEDIQGWLIHSDYDEVASFVSSDSLQNWIYDRIKWTFRNLSLGGFIVDCPQRERMGYGGDAHATSETGMLNFDLGSFYTKWMQDWRDVQGTEPMVGNMHDPNYARKEVTSGRIFNNGILPHTAPTYWGGGGPAWGGIVVTLPWFMYQQYGDTRALTDNYALIKGWLSFLDSHVENDLMKRFGGQWDFLGDWLWPNATAEGMNNDKDETLCLNNTYRVFNLRTAAKIARVIGDVAQAELWEEKADRSSEAINKRFYNKQLNIYSDGSMANLASALLAEVVPLADRGKIMQSLEKEILTNRKGHIHAGITGGALLFKLLRDTRRNDLIYSMTSKSTYPSWGYMKENGATTIWEMWEKDLPGLSLLHSSYLYPGAWYIDGVLGIKRDLPGFKQFIIEPPTRLETDLKWAEGIYNSPVGQIESKWHRAGEQFMLTINVPINSICLLKLDVQDAQIVKEKKDIVTKVGMEGKKVIFKLIPGRYEFL